MDKIKVAIIDDEYFFRQSLIKNLKEETDYEIIIVGDENNGEDGLKLILNQKPDIAFIDINMPIMNGLELLTALRDSGSGISCEIVIISGYASFEYAKQAIPLGVSNYLLKPVKKNELQSCLEKAIEKVQSNSANKLPVISNPDTKNYSLLTLEALNYINANLADKDLSVAQISTSLHSNYSYVCTSFKADTNMTINEYITEKRMELAKNEFFAGHKNISLVSKKVGYDDASYFGKCFKKAFGVSPSTYIRMIENG